MVVGQAGGLAATFQERTIAICSIEQSRAVKEINMTSAAAAPPPAPAPPSPPPSPALALAPTPTTIVDVPCRRKKCCCASFRGRLLARNELECTR
ncbi:hypothetical protein M0804_000728 [Polistes exclamans]|nr:hypothetical protein M0804_000728 [Polistes exclamans]